MLHILAVVGEGLIEQVLRSTDQKEIMQAKQSQNLGCLGQD